MENKFYNRIKEFWQSIARRDNGEQEEGLDQEKMIVLVISLILAFCLWMIVNLNKDFTLDVRMPIELGNITSEKSLVQELPDELTASLSGTGWNLISLYNSPPNIYVDVSNEEVNLFEQVRRQVSNNADVTVQTVDPLYLQVKLEPQQSKKVPVRANIDVQFSRQYDYVGQAELRPDSITIRGAKSHIADIDFWPTDSLTLKKVKKDFSNELTLKESGSLVTLSQRNVTYSAEVGQYTEGEVSVPVQLRNFPAGNMVTFSPSAVKVKYRVPLKDYSEFGEGNSFAAYVEYNQIQRDTTGFVSPEIQMVSEKAHLKIRSVRPGDVAYFTIIGN